MNDQQTMFGVPAVAPAASVKRALRQKVTGYADEEGTGAEGETCGSCDHFIARRYGSRPYFKCYLVIGDNDTGTHGAGTDIRKFAKACSMWKKKEGE